MNGPSHPGFKSNVPWWRALECIYAGGGRQEEYFSHLSNFPPSPKLNWFSYNTRLDSVHSKPLGSDSLGYVLHPDNLMERTFKAGDCMWTVNQVYNLSQFDAVVLCLLIRNKINLKMKLETVDRILMSRETTVVDPGGGTRGSEPPRPYQTWRLFQNFYCFLVPSYDLFASARKEVFPMPMATGVRRQSSLNQDPPIKNSWIRPWTSSLWCSQLCHSNLWQA